MRQALQHLATSCNLSRMNMTTRLAPGLFLLGPLRIFVDHRQVLPCGTFTITDGEHQKYQENRIQKIHIFYHFLHPTAAESWGPLHKSRLPPFGTFSGGFTTTFTKLCRFTSSLQTSKGSAASMERDMFQSVFNIFQYTYYVLYIYIYRYIANILIEYTLIHTIS